MDLKQLESYVKVVETKSFTRAAEVLGISQPTISTHVQSLESELDERLLLRDTKSLSVTRKGMELYNCALKMLGTRDRLLKNWKDEEGGVIRLGASTIPSAYILPKAIADYKESHPEVRFEVRQNDSAEVLAGLMSDHQDIGFIGMEPKEEGLISKAVCHEHMVLIAPSSDEFKKMKRDGNQDELRDVLRQHPILLREEGSGSQKQGDKILSGLGLSLNDLCIAARLDDTEAIKRMVMGGLGLAIISELAITRELKDGELVSFPIKLPEAERDFYLIYKEETELSEVEKDFINSL